MQTEVQKINQRVKLFSKKYAKCKPKKPLVGQIKIEKAKFFFFKVKIKPFKCFYMDTAT